MATAKAQMNVQVAPALRNLARTCALARRQSLNAWVERAIEEKAARDRKTFDLDGMSKALKGIAKQYLAGKVATEAEMLAMAQRVAAEDTEDGLPVEYYTVPQSAPKKGPRSPRSRNR